ncbi:MAG: SDR family oxidoreductase [Gammaproteobacteria bacterium]
MNAENSQLALVTGASSGIGAEIARELAARGVDLILSARRIDRLQQLATELKTRHKVGAEVLAADLSTVDGVQALWKTVQDRGRPVGVLVNNAGLGLYGAYARSDIDMLLKMLSVDIVALSLLTRLALPTMLQRRSGRILNVASLAAFQPAGPGMSAYYAAKNYVLALTRGLAVELKGSGVTATALCPGPTPTEFGEVSDAADTGLFKVLPQTSAAMVARKGVEGMLAGKVSVVPGLFNRLLAIGGELPPRAIAVMINQMLLR